MHQDLNDLRFFAEVVKKGGFGRAATALGVPKSRVSRRVRELEDALGVRLLQRTTRRQSLTEIGAAYYQHCQAMLAAAEAADKTVQTLSRAPRGHLRVSCPVGVAHYEVGPVLGEFLQKFPEVQLELLINNRRVDLVEERIDLALRVRNSGDEEPGLVTRRLKAKHQVLVAAPSLFAGRKLPREASELRDLRGLVFGTEPESAHWRLVNARGDAIEIRTRAQLFADDFLVLKQAVLHGAGVTLIPLSACDEEVAQGRLVRLLPEYFGEAGTLQLAYASARGIAPAVRALIDFLVDRLGEAPARARKTGRA